MSELKVTNIKRQLELIGNKSLIISNQFGKITIIVNTYPSLPKGKEYIRMMGIVLQDNTTNYAGIYYTLDGDNWLLFNRQFTNNYIAKLDNKVDKVTGKGLSTNDYTTSEKNQVTLIQDKVDKIPGKQLSTNDFTNDDKNKLNSLFNYNDVNIQNELNNRPTFIEVDNKIQAVIGSAPEALDTLQEIASELNNNENATATIINELSNKVDKINGKQLSSEDYTLLEKQKLANLSNYNDSVILEIISVIENNIIDLQNTKVDKELGKGLSTLDYTQEDKDILTTISDKVDKVQGKGLSDINFTQQDKTKLDSLENYDDTELRNEINLSSNKITKIDNIDNIYTDIIPLINPNGELYPSTTKLSDIVQAIETSNENANNYINEQISLLGDKINYKGYWSIISDDIKLPTYCKPGDLYILQYSFDVETTHYEAEDILLCINSFGTTTEQNPSDFKQLRDINLIKELIRISEQNANIYTDSKINLLNFPDISNKLDRLLNPIAGNIPIINSNGTLETSDTSIIQLQDNIVQAEENAKLYAEQLVIGLYDDRGAYDASSNTFPINGGSGENGTILRGDAWTISVEGTLNGILLSPLSSIRAFEDNPGQDANKWVIVPVGGSSLSYTPENVTNKVTSFQQTPTNTAYPSEKLVKDNLDLKVDKINGKGLSTEDYTTNEKNDVTLIANKVNYHGVVNPNAITFNVDNITRILTVAYNTIPYTVYINGIRYNVDIDLSIQIGSGLGQHFIWYYINNGVVALATSQTVWDLLNTTYTPCAVCSWDGTYLIPSDELHDYRRNLLEHKNQHDSWGAQYVSGFTKSPTFNINNTFNFIGGVIRDEERYHSLSGTLTTCRIGYKASGGATMQYDAIGSGFAKLNGNIPVWDNNGILTDITNNNYGIYWIYATNRKESTALVSIVGQSNYANITDAQAAPLPTLSGMSVAEWKLLYRVICKRTGSSIGSIQVDPLYNQSTGPAISGGTLTILSAGNVTNIPSGDITSTNQQAVNDELDTKKATKASPTFWDLIDNLKRIILNLSNITSGQTRIITFPNRDLDLGNATTGTLEFCVSGNGGIIQVAQYGGYVQIPYSCTITGWSISEGSPTPVNSTATMDVYKKSSFYPQAADTIFPSTKPNLTTQTSNSATGLNISVAAGDWFTCAITANNNAVILNLVLTVTKS